MASGDHSELRRIANDASYSDRERAKAEHDRMCKVYGPQSTVSRQAWCKLVAATAAEMRTK